MILPLRATTPPSEAANVVPMRVCKKRFQKVRYKLPASPLAEIKLPKLAASATEAILKMFLNVKTR